MKRNTNLGFIRTRRSSNGSQQNRRGFTLIELLVVIAIIGLLASVVQAALGNARSSARDAKRMADVHSIQTAL